MYCNSDIAVTEPTITFLYVELLCWFAVIVPIYATLADRKKMVHEFSSHESLQAIGRVLVKSRSSEYLLNNSIAVQQFKVIFGSCKFFFFSIVVVVDVVWC